MFLKKLYKQNKYWFCIVLLFAAGQLFINYKRGVEFSPFYHYGMFSIFFKKKTTYEATEVTVAGKRLQPKNFTPNGWDNIVIPIALYENQEKWNSEMYKATIKRLLHTNDSLLYVNGNLTDDVFKKWYQQRIVRLLNLRDTATDVQFKIVSYRQINDTLQR